MSRRYKGAPIPPWLPLVLILLLLAATPAQAIRPAEDAMPATTPTPIPVGTPPILSMSGYLYDFPMSPDPTPTPTSTVTPAGIQNGDLETGDFTSWAHGGSYPQSVVPQLSNGEPPYQGNYCASLGMPVPCTSQAAASAWMYQEFIVPNVSGTVSVSFAYRIFTNDIYDWASFHVELRAPDDALLARILRDGYDPPDHVAKCNNDLGWKTFSYNLEAFKGQTVRIYFESKNEWDGGYGIWTYVDDVKLQTTPTVTPTRTVTTPTVTPTCTVTPTPTATPPCFELVVNGGFETAGGWATNRADRSTDQARSGQWSMLIGKDLPAHQFSYASTWQLVTIPANATHATLTFWYWPAGEDTEGDAQLGIIYDQNLSHPLATVFSTLSNTQTWTPVIFDLSPWIGQGINLYFGVINDEDGLLTRMYVDDVSVCCWTGTATQTPTPTSTYTRTVTPTPTATDTPGGPITPILTATASTGSLCVLVYNDRNGNQLRDPDEGLLSGAIVTVTTAGGALVGVRLTDGTEPYCFTGLTPGVYMVKEQNPPGYVSTTFDAGGVNVDAGYSTLVEFGDLALPTPTSTATPTRTPTATSTSTPTPTTTPTITAAATPGLTATTTPTISQPSLRIYLPLLMKSWSILGTDTPTPTSTRVPTVPPLPTLLPPPTVPPLNTPTAMPPEKIANFRVSDRPGGPRVVNFPTGTNVIYAVFDYHDAQNMQVAVRVYDSQGNVMHYILKMYNGSGADSIEINHGAPFPDTPPGGVGYVTVIYVDFYPADYQTWTVGSGATPPPGTPTFTPTPTATPTNTPTPTPTPTSTPAWQRQSPPVSPSRRLEMGFVYDTARHVVVAVGGTDWNVAFGETWEYDGANWTLREDVPKSPARIRPAMVYDRGRQVTVLFGGSNLGDAEFFSDTWEYDGYQWLQRSVSNPPSPRNGAAVAYDPVRQRMVLFGGYYRWGPTRFFDDTWEYDGAQWVQRSPAHHPEARETAHMVFDAARSKMVLFGGGREAGSVVYNDTWEWDGNDWTQRLDLPTSPPARWAHSMTYDGDRQRTILFGGLTGITAAFDDTWEYDGQTWIQVMAPPRPSARWDSGLAYDLLNKRTVLFGGMDWDGNFGRLNDTWHYSGTLTPVAWVYLPFIIKTGPAMPTPTETPTSTPTATPTNTPTAMPPEKIANFRVSDRPCGPRVENFPTGTSVIYAVFDYHDAQNMQIEVRVYDLQGNRIHDTTQMYNGAGTASIEINHGAPFPDTSQGQFYLTIICYADTGYLVASQTWTVGGGQAPTATPTSISPTPTATLVPPSPTPPPFDYYWEPNDTFEQATSITPGSDLNNPTTFIGAISTDTDVDFYKFTLTNPFTQAYISLVLLPQDYDLYLYDNTKTLVDYSINSGLANEYITRTLTSGLYYIKVSSTNGSYDYRPYTLQVTLIPSQSPAALMTPPAVGILSLAKYADVASYRLQVDGASQ